MRLHETEFWWPRHIPKDGNQAENGRSLRYHFVQSHPEFEDAEGYLEGPCSVLEMMVGLTLRCETIMDDTRYGDRTTQWFWGMVQSLGLSTMTDDRFESDFVNERLNIFLNREYEPNGRGGLFTVRRCEADMRKLEIFAQLCMYLNSIN